jgi:hypothetical protein
MEKISQADKVILIMTESYKKKADDRTKGVGYEFQMISNLVFGNARKNKLFTYIKTRNEGFQCTGNT